jgi:hypothetical protein
MVDEKERNRKPSRYVTPKGLEAEFEPGSRMRVLKNRATSGYMEDYGPLTAFFVDALERRLGKGPKG